MKIVKKLVRKIFSQLGLCVSRDDSKARASFAFLKQKNYLNEKENPVVVDLGANVGQTINRYRNVFENPKFYCFEASLTNFKELEKGFAADDEVVLFNLAVSDSEGSLLLNEPSHAEPGDWHSQTSSILNRTEESETFYTDRETNTVEVEVKAKRLDAVFKDIEVSHIDVLKIDIEGAELLALKGASDLLESEAVSLIYMECSLYPRWDGVPLYHDLASYLEKFGYRLVNLFNITVKQDQIWVCDAVFLSDKAYIKWRGTK